MSLVGAYDLVIFDLDGVIYLIDKPIAGAAEAVERLRQEGTAIAYATNNASRRAPDVAALLTGMGVSATPDEVLTSAGAAAAMLAERLPADAPLVSCRPGGAPLPPGGYDLWARLAITPDDGPALTSFGGPWPITIT